MRTVLAKPPRLPLVAPSILSADFSAMADDCAHALHAGGDLLHLDVMDGHFVPNLTMGPDMCRWLRARFPDACLDVHLMVDRPEMFLEPFAKSGADHCTFHIERASGDEARRLADRCRILGMTAGVALNPPTAVEPVLAVADAFDMVLIMSVNPGFSGQAFIPAVLDKARAVRRVLPAGRRVEIDGGVGPANAQAVRDAGVDVLVAASAIFGVPREHRADAIAAIRGLPNG